MGGGGEERERRRGKDKDIKNLTGYECHAWLHFGTALSMANEKSLKDIRNTNLRESGIYFVHQNFVQRFDVA